jgi:hypothetical protein
MKALKTLSPQEWLAIKTCQNQHTSDASKEWLAIKTCQS